MIGKFQLAEKKRRHVLKRSNQSAQDAYWENIEAKETGMPGIAEGSKMNRYYESNLPEGYKETLAIDANDRIHGAKMQAAGMITAAVLICIFFFAYALPRMSEISAGFTLIKGFGFILSYFLYVTLHELTHGAVYKLMTKQKLTFGFKPPVAYCGVPDVYTYRITSLFSLLAPFAVYTVLFSVLFFFVDDAFSKAMILALTALHVSGCVGDLYGVGLFLFRFKDPATLRKDMGPEQIYYTKA